MDGLMDGWMDGWMVEQMDGKLDGWTDSCRYDDRKIVCLRQISVDGWPNKWING